MNIEDFRAYCLAKAGTTEDLPFDEDTLVFKVAGKIFALCSILAYTEGINLKCDPDKIIELRELHTQVKPGYHMNKEHWITVLPEAGLSEVLLKQLIDESYNLVVAKLTVSQKTTLNFK